MYFILIAYILILNDSIFTYFLKTYNPNFPILAFAPIFLFLHLIYNPSQLKNITFWYYLIIFIGLCGYSLGIYSIDNVNSNRLFQILSAFTAWLVGYFSTTFRTNILKITFFSKIIHVLICLIAILELYPSVFPLEKTLWSANGILEIRPAITTDQNFEILYLLPLIGLFFTSLNTNKFINIILSFILILLTFYILSSLQTRSGILIFLSCFIFCLMLFLLKSKKVLYFIFIILIFTTTIFILHIKYNIFDLIIYRFTEHNFNTAQGRLHSLLYFFDKIIEPKYWIPQGNLDYMKISNGNIPHSNITAHLMEGGIIGVIVWLSIIIIPSLKVIIRSLKINKTPIFITFAIISAGSIAAQLSLNVPFFDVIWLYSGFCAGLIHTSKKKLIST